MQRANLTEKAIHGLACCNQSTDYDRKACKDCPYNHEYTDGDIKHLCEITKLREDALSVLKAQDEVIRDLRKAGYPHGYEQEAPWIVNYLDGITEVIKKAVRLNNG